MLDKIHAAAFHEVLELTRPPDPELVGLIERAFLEGQIDGPEADLAFFSLLGRSIQPDQFEI